jgi:hypothetical protein
VRERTRAGLTLVELLIAFTVFVMFVTALVALGTAGLETWSQGEARKDIYDRAQRALDLVAEDLRNTWADDVWYKDAGGRDLQHACFIGDTDKNKLARLRFVRSGRQDEMRTSADMRIRPPTADIHYTDLWEVLYLMGGTVEKPVPLRCVRYFDRRTNESLLNAEDIVDPTGRFIQTNAQVVDDGLLYLGFRYWSQYSTTWLEAKCFTCEVLDHKLREQWTKPGKCQIKTGERVCNKDLKETVIDPLEPASKAAKRLLPPSAVWDSSRVKLETRWVLKKTRQDFNNPDFVYPEIVQITLVLESTAPDVRGPRLAEAIDDKANTVRITNAKALPDGPAFAKIEGEWISFETRTTTELHRVRRGQRGSTAVPHAAGATVRHGETFVRDVYIPVYREAAR